MEPVLSVEDKQYLNLLAHLRKQSSKLPLETFKSTLPYYLSRLAIEHVTTLTATILVSGYWLPEKAERVLAIGNIFHYATTLRYSRIDEEKRNSLFSLTRSRQSQMKSWINAVMKGSSSGNTLLRLSIYGGINSGVLEISRLEEDIRSLSIDPQRAFVYTMAKNFDSDDSFWNEGFQPSGALNDVEKTLLTILAEYLTKVPSEQWHVTNMQKFIDFSMNGLTSLFKNGTFLREMPVNSDNGQYKVPDNCSTFNTLRDCLDDPVYRRIASMSKIIAQALHISAERHSLQSEGMIGSVLDCLERISSAIEADFVSKRLAYLDSDEKIATDSRQLVTDVWSILKSFLFSNLMITQSILDTLIHYPHTSSPPPFTSSVAQSVLRILVNLSFIVSKLGGLSSNTSVVELKRCFYTAVDCFSIDPECCNEFVVRLCHTMKEQLANLEPRLLEAKLATVLLLIEQLVPVLTETMLQNHVVPLCLPLLNNNSQREVYESAHSVMLSIFGSYADRKQGETVDFTDQGEHNLVEKLVPYYCKTLLENSEEDKLTTDQLRLAFTNLVRSARYGQKYRNELAWFCIEMIQSEIRKNVIKQETAIVLAPHSRRLCLTLISLLSAVSFRILGPLAQIIEQIIKKLDDKEVQLSLLKEIKEEIMERVGDDGKRFCLDWWGQLEHVIE